MSRLQDTTEEQGQTESLKNEMHYVLTTHIKKSVVRQYIKCTSVNIHTVNFGKTEQKALHLACAHNNANHVRVLLQYGSDVNVCDLNQMSPLHYALNQNKVNIKIVKLLLTHGANANSADIKGNTPLHIVLRNSCLRRKCDILKLLIKFGGDVCIPNLVGEMPILIAKTNNENNLLSSLLSPLTVDIFTRQLEKYPFVNVFKNGRTCQVLKEHVLPLAIKRGLYRGLVAAAQNGSFSDFKLTFSRLSRLDYESAGNMLAKFFKRVIIFNKKPGYTEICTEQRCQNCSWERVYRETARMWGLEPKCSLYIQDTVRREGGSECRDNLDVLLELIACSSIDHAGNTLLHFAVKSLRRGMLLLLLQMCSFKPNVQNNAGLTALHFACIAYSADNGYDAIQTIKVLLDYGADPNICDKSGKNCYHLAAVSPCPKILSVLFDHVVLNDLTTYYDMLTIAMHLKNSETFKAILSEGRVRKFSKKTEQQLFCDLCETCVLWEHYMSMIYASILELAMFKGSYKFIYELIDVMSSRKRNLQTKIIVHFNKDCRDPLGNTLLHLCCWFGSSMGLLSVVIDTLGLDIYAKNFDGNTALHFACFDTSVYTKIIKAREVVEKPCYRIIGKRKTEFYYEDVDETSDVRSFYSNHERYTQHMFPMHHAGSGVSDKVEIVKVLCDLGANVHCMNSYGETPLYLACVTSSIASVYHLFTELGANINIKVKDGPSLLDVALHHDYKGNGSVIKFLVEYGDANILLGLVDNIQMVSVSKKETLLHLACSTEPSANVRLWLKVLLEKGAKVDVKNIRGQTPMHKLLHNYDAASLQLLLDASKQSHYNKLDMKYLLENILSYAIENKLAPASVKQLLDHGVDPNARCPYSVVGYNTRCKRPQANAMKKACFVSNELCLKLLLIYGGNANSLDTTNYMCSFIPTFYYNGVSRLKEIYTFLCHGFDATKLNFKNADTTLHEYCSSHSNHKHDMECRRAYQMFVTAGRSMNVVWKSPNVIVNRANPDDIRDNNNFMLACGYIPSTHDDGTLATVFDTNVPLLTALCCRVIRERLLPNAWVRIDKLPLPQQLQQRVTLNHEKYFEKFSVDVSHLFKH